MANTKEYKIIINGLTESVKAVESLNKELDSLEARIKALEGKTVGVNTSGGGSKSSSTGALSEEEKIQKQIEQTQEKINALRADEYQELLHQKDILKDVKKESEGRFSADNLALKEYANTMQGLKDKLRDLKATINNTDLSDTDTLSKLSDEANQITSKLKEMEGAYGTFSRNVGNYANGVAEGMQKYTIEIGGTVREFNTAREAAKSLTNELLNLPEGAEGAEDLRKALQQIKSEIQDLNKSSVVMDNLLDTMEGFMAVANAGQGIRALFGVDDAEIQKSIKNLVALQNVLKGIETINKQINTGEGVGKWIAPFNTGIDKATAKLLTFNTALLGTGKAAKVAAVSINAFGKALKLAVSAGILIAVDLIIEKLMDLVESFKKVDKATEEAIETEKVISKAYAEGSATLVKYQTIVKNFNGTKEQEKRVVEELNRELGSSLGTYSSIGEWMDVLTKKGEKYIEMLMLQAKAQAAFNRLVAAQQSLMDAENASTEDYRTFINDIQDFIWTGWGNKSANAARAAGIRSAKEYVEGAEEELRENQKELQDFMEKNGLGEYAPQIEKNGEKTKAAVEKVDDELIKLRIRNMKEGLNKTIKQLEEERKAELAKIDKNSRDAGEKRLEILRYYNSKILEERQKYAEKTEKLYQDMIKSIRDYEIKNNKTLIDIIEKDFEQTKEKYDKRLSEYANQGISSYGIQGKNQLSPSTQINLGIVSTGNDEFIKDMKELVDKMREAQTVGNAYGSMLEKQRAIQNKMNDEQKKALELQIAKTKELYEEKLKVYQEKEQSNIDKYGSENVQTTKQSLVQESYSKELSTIFNQRYTLYENYWDRIFELTKVASEEVYKKAIELEEYEYSARTDNALNYYNEQLKITNDYYDTQEQNIEAWYRKGEISEAEYYEELEQLHNNYTNAQKELEEQYETEKADLKKQHEQNEIEAEQQKNKKLLDVNKEYFNFRLQELRDYQTAISNLESKQPVTDIFGVTNFKKTNENNRNLLNSYQTLTDQIVGLKQQLQAKLNANEISFDDFQNANRELDSFAENVGEKMDEVKYKLSIGGQIQQFVQDIQGYFQEVMNSFNTIMQAVWQMQDNAFDDEQEELDKWNDELDKKLDEQQEIVQQHKDAIDSIEDELATSRGDRRQHLIDQLNAEMAAQRAAKKQEQKIQKEKEAAQKKQDALDKKRKKAQYERDMLQAIVNGAMAVTYAAMNAWPVPAIPMMALAAATTAAQIAIMASNKPYAKGGLLEGPSHKQGGIPVGNTGIEVEGKEYVIRKKSTTPNVELLDMINRSERKLNLDDFIDFYTSGKVKKNISSISPKAKFADGGTIPTISNDYAFDDRLISAFEDYSNRPVIVSVQDINNRQAAVKNVQVLAGIVQE